MLIVRGTCNDGCERVLWWHQALYLLLTDFNDGAKSPTFVSETFAAGGPLFFDLNQHHSASYTRNIHINGQSQHPILYLLLDIVPMAIAEL